MKVFLRVLVSLGVGLFSIATPALAGSDVYLIYPTSWCADDEGNLLHFTLVELGISGAYSYSDPIHGRFFPSLTHEHGGYYLPRCAGLLSAGFDFFQVTSGDSGEVVHVTVLLGDGYPQEEEVGEGAEGGAVSDPWSLVWEDPEATSGVEIVYWPGGSGLAGTHGFRVDSGQTADSYLTFSFEEELDTYQPPGQFGEGNSGVETRIIIRPPSFPSLSLTGGSPAFPSNASFGESSVGREQIVYAAGSFDGSAPPDTLLRMWDDAGTVRIRAEAATTNGSVETSWCTLTPGAPNHVLVDHRHFLDGRDELILTVGDGVLNTCQQREDGFVSAHPPVNQYRFGAMGAQDGGLAFEFDEAEVKIRRFDSEFRRDLMDDFEGGTWDAQWVAVNPASLTVSPSGAHTGFQGLEIEPVHLVPSLLNYTLPAATDQLACRFSLNVAITSQEITPSRVLFFAATGNSGDQVRFWVREVNSTYQLQAHSGTSSSGWLPLRRLPAKVDLRLDDGRLEFWVEGCGPGDCDNGHVVLPAAGIEQVTKVRLGAISVPSRTGGTLSVDDFLCLEGSSSSPNGLVP